MLVDNRFQYGTDFNRQQAQQQQQLQQHHFIAQEEILEQGREITKERDRLLQMSHKLQPQIITKDLTLSSTKYHRSSNNENDDNDDDEDVDVDVDVDVDMETTDTELLNADDMVGRTDVTANTDAVDNQDDTEGQSTLHLPHARWPNHWSDTNAQLSETTSTVTYKWLTSPWSECSQKCGSAGSGLRVSLNCILHFEFS